MRLAEADFRTHLGRAVGLYAAKPHDAPGPVSWGTFLDNLYAVDFAVAVGCLTGSGPAWEALFNARTGRSDCLLIDALRARAARMYPRDDERQDTTVTEFWSGLIVCDGDGLPVLARYDGQRPLVPWLITVFQNGQYSRLRAPRRGVSTDDPDDLVPPTPPPDPDPHGRWHELFVEAARNWLATLADDDRLLLGLRWRYRLSQREAAKYFNLNEGTLTRRTDKLADAAREVLTNRLTAAGWTGDGLDVLIATELGAVLTDDPRLSGDALARLLAARGKTAPPEAT